MYTNAVYKMDPIIQNEIPHEFSHKKGRVGKTSPPRNSFCKPTTSFQVSFAIPSSYSFLNVSIISFVVSRFLTIVTP